MSRLLFPYSDAPYFILEVKLLNLVQVFAIEAMAKTLYDLTGYLRPFRAKALLEDRLYAIGLQLDCVKSLLLSWDSDVRAGLDDGSRV